MASKRVDPQWIRGKTDELAVSQGCYFDGQAGRYVVEWIETFCKRTKGRGDGTVKLIPWQRDFLMRLFGWKRPDGTRRYRDAYLEIPKKNGKSFILSCLALFMTMGDGEGSAETYLAATNSKQARIIFDECVKMIKMNGTLRKRLSVQDTYKRITHRASFSKIECATLDSDALDGWDMSCGIIDEYHRHKTSKLLDVMRYAGSARESPLLVIITTAGNDRTSPCWTEHERALKVIAGESKDTSTLAIVYGCDRDNEDIENPKVWARVNPSLGYTLTIDDLKRDMDKVKESPSQLDNFLRLRLNVWTQPETSYIKHEHWIKGNASIDLESLKGQAVHTGMDISAKLDITAFSMLFGNPDDGIKVLCKCWIPEKQAIAREKIDGIPYSRWAKEGWIRIVPGDVIDYDLVTSEIVGLSQLYKFKSITSDDWGGSEAVGQRLKSHGLRVSFMGQGFRSMSGVTKELERLCIMGKFQHGGNPILKWMNDNAIVKSDPAGNVKLVKPGKDAPKKIDGLISTLEAFYGLDMSRKQTNAYSTRGVQFVGRKV